MPQRGGVARVRNAAPGALRRGGAAALQQRSEPLLAKGLFPAGTLKYAGHGSLRAAHGAGRTDASKKVARASRYASASAPSDALRVRATIPDLIVSEAASVLSINHVAWAWGCMGVARPARPCHRGARGVRSPSWGTLQGAPPDS